MSTAPTISANLRRWTWAGYMLLSFSLTHMPPPEKGVIPHWLSDVLMHGAGYAVMGVLTIWMLSADRRVIGWKKATLCFALLLSYAAMDEQTQKLVGRSCELSDWLADGFGAAIGVVLATAFVRFRHPKSRPLNNVCRR